MQVHMVSPQFSLTPSLREYLERRLRNAFAPLGGKIAEIAIRLRDLNGPRGGRDMQCQVSVSMPGMPAVVIREVQENMYNAIDRAVKRAAYRVAGLRRVRAWQDGGPCQSRKLRPKLEPVGAGGQRQTIQFLPLCLA